MEWGSEEGDRGEGGKWLRRESEWNRGRRYWRERTGQQRRNRGSKGGGEKGMRE